VAAGLGASSDYTDILDEDVTPIAVGMDVAPNQADSAGFPGSIGAQESEYLASGHAKGDVVHGVIGPECLVKMKHAETVRRFFCSFDLGADHRIDGVYLFFRVLRLRFFSCEDRGLVTAVPPDEYDKENYSLNNKIENRSAIDIQSSGI
jgi:hypothetical protein